MKPKLYAVFEHRPNGEWVQISQLAWTKSRALQALRVAQMYSHFECDVRAIELAD
jgi:hypothetical protein